MGGKWADAAQSRVLPDPLNGHGFIRVPDTQPAETAAFVNSLKQVPKHGLHNPLKNPQRCAHDALSSYPSLSKLFSQDDARGAASSADTCCMGTFLFGLQSSSGVLR